ncbi:MAG: hypothetical protein AAF899_13870 [Pseudomonadota bacterium]
MRRLAQLPEFPPADDEAEAEADQAAPPPAHAGGVPSMPNDTASRPPSEPSTGAFGPDQDTQHRPTSAPVMPDHAMVSGSSEPERTFSTEGAPVSDTADGVPPGPVQSREAMNDASAHADASAEVTMPAPPMIDMASLPETSDAGPTPSPEPQAEPPVAEHDGRAVADGVGNAAISSSSLDGLASAIDGFADQLDSVRTSIGETAAQAFADAARRCLPGVADAAAAAEIVRAARALAGTCQGGTIELRVAPDLVRPLAEALDRRMPAMTCVIAGDPQLTHGRAEISWRGDGCWPDPDQLAGAASKILGDAIARQTGEGTTG